MQLKEFLRRAQPEYYFGLIFWTPFWLLPVLSEKGIAPQQVVENIVAGIGVSAMLEAGANLAGSNRRYFYLAAGAILWIGAAAFIAYSVIERGMINSLALSDASQYTTTNGQQFSYVSDLGGIPPWLVALCAPFIALGFYWRQLSGPRKPVYAVTLLVAFLLPIPLKAANCAIARSCIAHKFSLGNIYPAAHYAPAASYLATASMIELRVALEQRSQAPRLFVRARKAPLTLVVVVGETFNRNHMSLYGYCRPTTPKLDTQASNLFVFRNVTSMLPLTAYGVPRAITLSEYSGQDAAHRISLIDVLNAGGFSTSWISNQLATSLGTSNIALLAQRARHRAWLNVGGELHNYDDVDPLDDDLIAPLSHALAQSDPRKAIFLHINGAHWPYTARYPSVFSPAALDAPIPGRQPVQSNLIRDYDLALRYDDELFANILTQLEHSKGDAALVLFGDHGEEVFDQIDWHGHIYPSVTRNMVEIPFIVWLSPSLREHRPELVRALQAAVGKRMQNTDIAATVVDIADLTVSGLKPERRPLTAQFRSTPRRNVDGDYDVDPNFGVTPSLPPLCPAHRS